jgi:hypothetical protein
MKILLLVAIALSLVGGVTVKSGFFNQSEVKGSQNGRFKKLAKEAKEKGKTHVTTASFSHTEYVGQIDSLNFLLRNYSFVVAELIEQKSYVSPSYDEVTTWSKFHTIDVLSQSDIINDSDIAPPSESSILTPDDFLIAQVGGNILIDGVSVKVEDQSFPLLKPGEQYLLVMSKNKSGVAILAGGPTGVFTLGENGVIKPLIKNDRSFQSAISSNLGQTLRDIKANIPMRQHETRQELRH